MTDHEIVTSFLDLLARKGLRLAPPVLRAEPPVTTVHGDNINVEMTMTVVAPIRVIAAPGCSPQTSDMAPILRAIEQDRAERGWPDLAPT